MKHLIMGTAGHVDHGKTALIKALTNIDCDTHKEEKRRGITINLGFSYLNLPHGESIGIIDVPGHKDFVNTMVSGACGIDFVLLVIAADSGIMPQTIEHVNIISALGIKKGIVALTKTDLVDDELAEMAKLEISEFLNNTTLKDIPVIGVSTITGKGISDLIKTIEEIIPEVEEKKKGELFRMFVDRSFVVKGIGTVVTGTVLNGNISTGNTVYLLPGESEHKIRSIERHSVPAESVTCGDRAAIQLIGIKKEDIIRGSVISDKILEPTKMIDANISLFNKDITLSNWSVVTFHSGTFESQARMHKLSIEKDNSILVQIHLEKPAILLTKDKFIIRNSSGDKTLGGGFIIDATPVHHRRRTTELEQNLLSLSKSISDENNFQELILIELKKEIRPFSVKEISEKLNLKSEDILKHFGSENEKSCLYNLPCNTVIINKEYEKDFINKIIHSLNAYHKENSLSDSGLGTIELVGKLCLNKIPFGKEYIESLLQKMNSQQLIENRCNTWIIKGFSQTIDNKTTEEINWLEKEFILYDCQKPAMAEIEEKAAVKKIPKEKIRKYLHYLTGKGKLTLFNNEYVHSDVVKKYKLALISSLEKSTDGMEIGEFRQSTGVSKRLAPILIALYESQKIIYTKTKGIKVQIYLK